MENYEFYGKFNLRMDTIRAFYSKKQGKITKSITSSLGIVLELSKKIPKRIYARRNALVNAYWNVKAKF